MQSHPIREFHRHSRRALSAIVAAALAAVPLLATWGLPAPVFAANDFAVVESGGVTSVNESGSTDTFTLTLTDAPRSNVVISVTSANTAEATVAPASLMFTPANWNTPQTVTVTGVNDTATDGNITTAIALSVVNDLSDDLFDGKAATVNVTTVDNEPSASAGFTVTESGGATIVDEGAATDTFTVTLNKAPVGNVVISAVSGNTAEATVSPSTLSFNPSNWDTPQTITVTGVDDTQSDGNQTTSIVLSVVDAFSADEYDIVADQSVSVTNNDNETQGPAFTVIQSDGRTSVNESGTLDTFTVVLNKQLASNVVVSVTSSDTGEATVAPSSLTFTTTNWNSAQVVTVTGVDDTMADGDQNATIVLSVVDALSADEYDAVPDQTFTFTTVDNEAAAPGFVVGQATNSARVNESGTTATFTVVLNKQPASNVVISVTSSNNAEAMAAPTSLTFTPANWNTAQTVTVTGVDDAAGDGNQSTSIVLSVVDSLSADEYDVMQDQTVMITTVDNDPPVMRNAPTLVSPSCGAKLTNLAPLLRWTQETGANWYQVQVVPFNNDGPGIDLIFGDPTIVALAQYQVREPNYGSLNPNYVMLPDITYTWRVRTAATPQSPVESDWTSWSAPCTFETAAKTSATISPVSPNAGAEVGHTLPTLVWTNSDATVFYYEVQVSRDQSFTADPATAVAPVYWELRHGGVTTPGNSYTVPNQYPLEAGKTYYWRVRPRVQADGTPVAWSPTWSFRTP